MQLERLADGARRGHVRAAAEIEPIALLVDLEVLALGDRVDQLDLEQLALVAEVLLRLVAAPHFLGEGRVLGDDLVHLLFDFARGRPGGTAPAWRNRKRTRCRSPGRSSPACRATRPAPLPPSRARRSCRISSSAAGSVRGTKLILASLVIGSDEVRQRAVELHGHRAFGERRRDALRDVEAGGAGLDLARRAIGKCQGDLGRSAMVSSPLTLCLPRR